MFKRALKSALDSVTHFIGEKIGTYYFEDFIRVYPDGLAYNKLGIRRKASGKEMKNFINHSKFYHFAAQFTAGKDVADVGCGSGYGTKILKEAGAASVSGFDISKASVRFARKHFSEYGSFSIATIVDIKNVADDTFDLTVNSEVLEHIKEYNMEQRAVEELKRITKNNGLIIMATPNTELLENHGFSFDEMKHLCEKNFSRFIIFENSFIPSDQHLRALWNDRVARNNTGTIISEEINFNECVLPDNQAPDLKRGLQPGILNLGTYSINTKLLHNTHSWTVVAVNDK